MAQDLLNEALAIIKNAETAGKHECYTPASELIKDVFLVMQRNGYLGNFEFVDDKKAGRFRVELIMKINNCGAISPRYSISVKNVEKSEVNYLPAKDFGVLIVSTNKGVMDHKEAKSLKTGGKLISFVY